MKGCVGERAEGAALLCLQPALYSLTSLCADVLLTLQPALLATRTLFTDITLH